MAKSSITLSFSTGFKEQIQEYMKDRNLILSHEIERALQPLLDEQAKQEGRTPEPNPNIPSGPKEQKLVCDFLRFIREADDESVEIAVRLIRNVLRQL